MLRPRPRARVVVLPSLLMLGLLAALAGCGSSGDEGSSAEPSKAAVACRSQWKGLGEDVDGHESGTNPSALASRWNNIAASVDHYATAASAEDCGQTLDQERTSIVALTAFAPRLEPYDMELRLEQVQADARRYASGPQPSAPAPSPDKNPDRLGGTNDKPQPGLRAPTPAAVGQALKTLAEQAPAATEQQGPGWEQAEVVDLADAAAVRKTIKDLAFLSSESEAYRACTPALLVITRAMATTAD